MIKEKNPNFSTRWVKYDNYEIVKYDNEFYIQPSADSDYEIYDPFDYSKDLLVDFLLIGREARLSYSRSDIYCELLSAEKNFQDMVLNFVKKYGLLGDITYAPLNNTFVTEKKVYLQKPYNVQSISLEEYISPFFKSVNNIDFNKTLTQEDLFNLYGNNNPYLELGIDNIYGLAFSKKYSEKIAFIITYARLLYDVFSDTEKYLAEDDLDKKTIYANLVSDFRPFGIGFELDLKDKAILHWNFNSLKQAIELILALNETNDRKEVKICKHCGKPFIAKNLNAEYDTPSCRNVANVYKNREKNKAD